MTQFYEEKKSLQLQTWLDSYESHWKVAQDSHIFELKVFCNTAVLCAGFKAVSVNSKVLKKFIG